MRARRARLLTAVRVVLALIAAGSLLHTGPVSAQDSGASAPASLGGYQGLATAAGLHLFYNPEGVLPISAPIDAGAPDAYATIASGPATFARSSILDPGDLVANPDALLALGVSGWQAGTIPPYPYRATASSGTGVPDAESSPAPGLGARAHADSSGSVATATMPRSDTPGFATFGSMSSTATTATDGTTVTVHARSEISDLDVLGVVTIGSVITDLTATSDGTTTTVSGGTTVTNASVLGTPVTINGEGVQPAPGSTPPGSTPPTTDPLTGLVGSLLRPLLGSLNDVLASAGIHITVAGPVQQGSGNTSQLTADGLRIDLVLSGGTLPVLAELIAAVPPLENPLPGAPSVEDLLVIAQARHVTAIDLARGQVSLSGRPTRPSNAPSIIGPVATPSFSPGSTGSSGGLVTSPPSIVAPAPAVVDSSTTRPDVSTGVGVGALVLLALLAQPLVGDRIARAAQALLAADSASCPWEES